MCGCRSSSPASPATSAPRSSRALAADGHRVRGFARSPERVAAAGVALDELVIGDALTGAGLERGDGRRRGRLLPDPLDGGRGRRRVPRAGAARRRALRRRRAGRRRAPRSSTSAASCRATGAASRHLASRLAVEESLLGAAPESIALRASIVIGARSRSFRFLVRLIERLPVLALPAWRANRTRPIDGRDVLAFLRRGRGRARGAGRALVGHRRPGHR